MRLLTKASSPLSETSRRNSSSATVWMRLVEPGLPIMNTASPRSTPVSLQRKKLSLVSSGSPSS